MTDCKDPVLFKGINFCSTVWGHLKNEVYVFSEVVESEKHIANLYGEELKTASDLPDFTGLDLSVVS